jgi:hypothetical protein
MTARTLLLALWAFTSSVSEAAPRGGGGGGRPPAARSGGAGKKPPSKPARPAPKPAPRPSTQTARPANPAPRPAARPAPAAAPRPAAARPPAVSSRPAVARPPAGAKPGSVAPQPRAVPTTQRTPSAPLAADVKNASLGHPARAVDPGALQTVGAKPGSFDPGTGGRPGGGAVSNDPRYHRPASYGVRPVGSSGPPVVVTYRGWYTGYWCHPWYRWQWGTSAVVWFGWTPYPWYDTWIPPYRWGWSWAPGYWSYGFWYPGYWMPVAPVPVGFVYVPGWWEDEVYVEGYYRSDARDGWDWVDGYYLEDGTYVRGHWQPAEDAPEGYVWEAGFWDGEEYHDGFWRPEFLDGYVWVSSYYDQDGLFRAGYWAPLDDKPGHQWIPGWFDGTEWIPGYWITDEEAQREDVEHWTPPEGVRDGRDAPAAPEAVEGEAPPSARIVEERTKRDGQKPVAVPVIVPREGKTETPPAPPPAPAP